MNGRGKILASLLILVLLLIFKATTGCGMSIIIPQGHWVYEVLDNLSKAKIPFIDEYYRPDVLLTRYDLADLLIRLRGQDFWPSHLKSFRGKLTYYQNNRINSPHT